MSCDSRRARLVPRRMAGRASRRRNFGAGQSWLQAGRGEKRGRFSRLRRIRRRNRKHHSEFVAKQPHPVLRHLDISSFSAQKRVILTAPKKTGMILADNGSGIFISGAPDSRWNNSDHSKLKMIAASDFDVVSMDPVYTNSNVPNGPSRAHGALLRTLPSRSARRDRGLRPAWSAFEQLAVFPRDRL